MKTIARPLTFALGLTVSAQAANITAAARLNILWLIAEDMSPHFGCYLQPNNIALMKQWAKQGK